MLTEGNADYCGHATLREHSNVTRSLLDRIQSIGRTLDSISLSERGIAHYDFHHRNVFRREGRVTGVIDWDGSRVGDPVFDLVTFAFWAESNDGHCEIESLEWFKDVIFGMLPPDALAPYAALMGLRSVGHLLRTGDVAGAEHMQVVTERWLDRCV